MNSKKLNHAISEAKRFLELATKAKNTAEDYRGKESSAAKRASMDLTRALADMRRPG